MGEFFTDDSQAPLISFTIRGELTFAQLQDHLRDYRAILDRGRPYVLLFDAREAGMADARNRKAYADFIITYTEDMKLLCKGGAFVVTSSLIQGAMTAVLWLAPLPFPHKVFTDMKEATTWLRSRL